MAHSNTTANNNTNNNLCVRLTKVLCSNAHFTSCKVLCSNAHFTSCVRAAALGGILLATILQDIVYTANRITSRISTMSSPRVKTTNE